MAGVPGSSGGRMYMVGMKQVMLNLNKEIVKIQDRSSKGLIMVAAYIRQKTEKQRPLTPVDLGNLRSSWFVVSSKSSIVGGDERQLMKKTFVGKRAEAILTDYIMAVMESQGLARRLAGIKFKRFVVFGYGAGYAGFVHEMVGAEFKRPGAEAKWLETHLKNNTHQILLILESEIKIPVRRSKNIKRKKI